MSDEDAGREQPATGQADDGADGGVPVRGDPQMVRGELGARLPSWLATSTAWTWRVLLLLIGLSAILVLLTRLYLVTLPIIVALILATLCVPPARALERRGVPRMLSATIVVVGGLAVVSGIVAAMAPAFVSQVQDLQPTIAEGIERVYAFLESNFGWDREEVIDLANQGVEIVRQQSGQLAQQFFAGAGIAVQAIAAIVLAIVLLFFFVKDGEQIVAWMRDRTPPAYRDTVRAVGARGWTALAGFVRGTAAIAMIDAIGIGIGLAIVGTPLVLPIAVLVFLGGFVPVIGAFITGLLAVVVALAAGGLQMALIVLAIVVGVQQFESNVLQPVIMRRAVALHPVVILAALTAGASLLGIIGAFLAVPVAATAAAMANELRLRHEAAIIAAPSSPEPLGGPGFGQGPASGAEAIAAAEEAEAAGTDGGEADAGTAGTGRTDAEVAAEAGEAPRE